MRAISRPWKTTLTQKKQHLGLCGNIPHTFQWEVISNTRNNTYMSNMNNHGEGHIPQPTKTRRFLCLHAAFVPAIVIVTWKKCHSRILLVGPDVGKISHGNDQPVHLTTQEPRRHDVLTHPTTQELRRHDVLTPISRIMKLKKCHTHISPNNQGTVLGTIFRREWTTTIMTTLVANATVARTRTNNYPQHTVAASVGIKSIKWSHNDGPQL